MNSTSCVLTKYNRYTDLCFVEVGYFEQTQFVCGCVLLPKEMMVLDDTETIQCVKIYFEKWVSELLQVNALRANTMRGDFLHLQKEIARGFYSLEECVKGSCFEVCFFVNLGELFSYKWRNGSMSRIVFGDAILFCSQQGLETVDIEAQSVEVFANKLEKQYIQAWDQAMEHACLITVGKGLL